MNPYWSVKKFQWTQLLKVIKQVPLWLANYYYFPNKTLLIKRVRIAGLTNIKMTLIYRNIIIWQSMSSNLLRSYECFSTSGSKDWSTTRSIRSKVGWSSGVFYQNCIIYSFQNNRNWNSLIFFFRYYVSDLGISFLVTILKVSSINRFNNFNKARRIIESVTFRFIRIT